jgi:hypothetical protein
MRVLLTSFSLLAVGFSPVHAGVLNIPPACGPENTDAQIRGGECRQFPVVGYDIQFCTPISGIDENYIVAEGIGQVWLVTDCNSGQSAEVLVKEFATDTDYYDEMISFRAQRLQADGQTSLLVITDHMASIGAKVELKYSILNAEVLKQNCSWSVPRERRCLPES